MDIKTCIDCTFFEEHTKFCRLNPPVPINTVDKEGRKCITSVFPVVKRPDSDWCSHFKDFDAC